MEKIMSEHVIVNAHGAVIVGPGEVTSPSWVEAAGGEVVGWVRESSEADLVDVPGDGLEHVRAGRTWHAVSRGFALIIRPAYFATREEAIAAVVCASKSPDYHVAVLGEPSPRGPQGGWTFEMPEGR